VIVAVPIPIYAISQKKYLSNLINRITYRQLGKTDIKKSNQNSKGHIITVFNSKLFK